jgi:hypothetical protein
MNIIGYIVVAGNVRRSAQLAIGDYDDVEFLRAKRWDLGNIPNWRAMSNNSVACSDTSKLSDEFWAGYNGNGEPYGMINLKLTRLIGRTGEPRPDTEVVAYNPCAEQSLESYETCCLAEMYLPNITSYDEFVDLLKLLYRINKHSLALPCNNSKETENVVHKNMRMGIGVTGYLQATEEQRGWLKDAYEELRAFDREYSSAHGWPISIKLTTTKPSGTLSLLPGVTPGVHPGYSQYMIRRMRIASNHSLVDLCRRKGYKVEFARGFDGKDDHSTCVVEFPFSYPEGTVLAKDTTAIDQLGYVRRLQEEWSDNSVSCTVYYRKEELPVIREYLAQNYNKSHKSLSFLLHSEHGFDQAPFEEIDKETYDKMVESSQPITSFTDELTLDLDDPDCATGACPIR